ncbi:MAG: fumarylacetoacetate hydrolase family protein [Saprospiraceae bacterium]|nr:fumarylacetoacetate hydrolase family protein [Saprospiraceae bacterium]|tara:strand:+ start:386 stop:1342 length:957 start_codon:yes stop_codon:yes gene_type:complete
MGQYIVKYQQDNKEIWGVNKGEKVFSLKNQPGSLADLIQKKEEFTLQNNLNKKGMSMESLDLLAPVTLPSKVICQGLNYASHRAEAALVATSKSNVMFSKDDSSITGANNPIVRPLNCECLDYEVELGLVLGKALDHSVEVTENNLHEYVAGMVLANDMSPRDLQYRDDYMQWFKAKSCRTMLPLGPVLYLMDKSDFKELYELKLQLWVNDELRQDATTDQLIFKPAATLTEISSFMNMNVGDLLLTGTPGGVIVKAPSKFKQGLATWLMTNEKKVAIFRKQKATYLQDGDVIKAQIKSNNGSIDLGIQTNRIVAYKS